MASSYVVDKPIETVIKYNKKIIKVYTVHKDDVDLMDRRDDPG